MMTAPDQISIELSISPQRPSMHIMTLTDLSQHIHDEALKTTHAIYTSTGFKPPPKQFTVLASFYLTRPIPSTPTVAASGLCFKVISLSTGTKCTPATKYSRHGELLHDTHAEVLARRGAVRWLMEEIGRMNNSPEYVSDWIIRTQFRTPNYDSDENPPCKLQAGVSLHMYISTLPCGDASMGFLASTQEAQMASLKSQSIHLFPTLQPHEASRGRDNYSRLGVLRTKPGRADSPSALSMSCSDKIARWSVLGILGGFASKFLEPVYLRNVVIGEFSQDEEGEEGNEMRELRMMVKEDCERALRVRIGKIEGLPDGYAVHPPEVRFTDMPFVHSKSELAKVTRTTGSCNESLCWVADSGPSEVLVNGLKRSTAPKNRYVEKYRPLLSRISMFKLYSRTLEIEGLPTLLDDVHYMTAKASSTRYQRAKAVLLGGIFSGWIRIDTQYQRFTLQGSNHQHHMYADKLS